MKQYARYASQGAELLRSVEDEVKAETARLLTRRGDISPEEDRKSVV